MDSGGISIISSKSLQTDTHVYHNEAFSPDSSDRKSSSGTIAGSITNAANGDRVPSEASQAKRDSNTVEFSLPQKRVSRDQRQSISTGPYRGMGKEELLRYSSRPLWRNLRYICITIVLTGWLALLITVVALVLTYPACRKAQERAWWQTSMIYRVYVRSFYDTNGDGIGDINGVRQKLEYLQDLGVDTLALSPIYKLAVDAPTDTHIVNHTDIDHVFGTLEEFKLLVNETHHRGMHITLDFIPNHTSDLHPWFLASKNGSDPRENQFRSYYVWAPGRGGNGLQLPNSWKTVDKCTPAWKINDDNIFYLHQFMESQPELNLRSEKVREELENILRFWLNLGVDGFYIRDADYLFEDYDLRDHVENGTSLDCGAATPNSIASNRRYTKGLTEIFDMLARWRAFLDDFGNDTSRLRILFADVDGSSEYVMNYYGLFNRDGVHFPLNKFTLHLNITTGGDNIRRMVSNWMGNMPKEHWPTWMGGDDRSERLADRLGDNSGLFLIMTMLLPGTPYFYYGDEVGLQAVNTTNTTHEVSMALPMRGPMQWNNRSLAGFCSQYCDHAWMPVNPEYRNEMNVEAQMRDPESIWNLFHNLTLLRKDTPSFEYGDYIAAVQDDEVFSFVREYDGKKGYLVVLNFAGKEVTKDFRGLHATIPDSATVEIVAGVGAHHSKAGSANLNSLSLAPSEGIVVSWDYKAKEL